MVDKKSLIKKKTPWAKYIVVGICVPAILWILYDMAFQFVFRNYDFSTKIPAAIVVTYFNLPIFLVGVLLTMALLFGILAMVYLYIKFGSQIFEEG
jgi:hypothetical protein